MWPPATRGSHPPRVTADSRSRPSWVRTRVGPHRSWCIDTRSVEEWSSGAGAHPFGVLLTGQSSSLPLNRRTAAVPRMVMNAMPARYFLLTRISGPRQAMYINR